MTFKPFESFGGGLSRFGWIVPALLFGAACDFSAPSSDAPSGKAVFVAIDKSMSAASDERIFRRSMESIFRSLGPGDRIVVGLITDRSARDFVTAIDRRLPAPFPAQTLMDNEFQYRQALEAYQTEWDSFTGELWGEIQEVLDVPPAAIRTTIFETLLVAQSIFASESGTKILVLLSDMLEDSALANFERDRIDDEYIEALIERQKTQGILPDLEGVIVYAVGAQAPTVERTAAVEKFWRRYFEEAGAPLGPGRYARTLVSFDH